MLKKILGTIIFLFININITLPADRTHHGDLVVQGNEVYKIENEDFTQIAGNVIVKENGRLIINNSNFFYQTEYQGEFGWHLSDSAAVEIINSKIIDQYTHGVYITDNAAMIYNNSINGNEHQSHGGQQISIDNNGSLALGIEKTGGM